SQLALATADGRRVRAGLLACVRNLETEGYRVPPMPWRLIRLSLFLIVIGLLPRILPVIHLAPPSPARLLEWAFVPPQIRQWVVDSVAYQVALSLGLALLVLAGLFVVRSLLRERDADRPISTSEVLLAEAAAIHGPKPDDPQLTQAADEFRVRSEK